MCVKSEACCHRAAWGLGHSTAGVRSAACSWQRRPARRTQHGGRLQVARSEPPGGPLQVCEGELRRAFARMQACAQHQPCQGPHWPVGAAQLRNISSGSYGFVVLALDQDTNEQVCCACALKRVIYAAASAACLRVASVCVCIAAASAHTCSLVWTRGCAATHTLTTRSR